MKRMLTILLWIGGGYVALLGLLFVMQNQLLFQPTSSMLMSPDEYGFAYEDVNVQTEDGETLHAWWIPAEEDRATLLFFHGNAGNISGRLGSVRQFHDLGLNVLIVDYRGYGQSSGSPSEEGLYRDAMASWQHLTEERGRSADEIVLFGRSLGASVATWLAMEASAAAMILESPFVSVPDLAMYHYPFVPFRGLVRNDFNNVERVSQLDIPKLILHAEADRVVPYEHGREVYEAAAEPKTFFTLDGGHNDGFMVSEPDYSRTIDAFLQKHGI